MTALLPPNLLKLFAPRPQPQFLKPLSKDERSRGPNKLSGLGTLAQRIREEAEDAEVKKGITDAAEAAERARPNGAGDDVKMESTDQEKLEEVEEVGGPKRKRKKGPVRKMDKIAELGVVGQEAINMRREARKARQEEYKKNLEKNCEVSISSCSSYKLAYQIDHKMMRMHLEIPTKPFSYLD